MPATNGEIAPVPLANCIVIPALVPEVIEVPIIVERSAARPMIRARVTISEPVADPKQVLATQKARSILLQQAYADLLAWKRRYQMLLSAAGRQTLDDLVDSLDEAGG
jgi:hypothetical protein